LDGTPTSKTGELPGLITLWVLMTLSILIDDQT